APAGTAFSLVETNIDQVQQQSSTLSLSAGNNFLTAPAAGNYVFKLKISSAPYISLSRQYEVQVTCANPTFTAAIPDRTKIDVAGTNNASTYSAAAVIAAANGQPPYSCAWDPTGTGIMDTPLADCGNPATVYVNYVTTRKIGLIVKDACNTTYTIYQN